ncbi:MAG: DUF5615 family PIN-like protein, partial [Hyphomicrobiaceae bacterium]
MRATPSARRECFLALRDMRFLANENFPGAAVAALVADGHDVVWVRVAAPGMSDPDV